MVYDPDRDIAVLYVPGPDRRAAGLHRGGPHRRQRHRRRLPAGRPVPRRTRPGSAASSRPRGQTSTSSKTVVREIYALRARVRPGNSGGPLDQHQRCGLRRRVRRRGRRPGDRLRADRQGGLLRRGGRAGPRPPGSARRAATSSGGELAPTAPWRRRPAPPAWPSPACRAPCRMRRSCASWCEMTRRTSPARSQASSRLAPRTALAQQRAEQMRRRAWRQCGPWDVLGSEGRADRRLGNRAH